MKIRFRLLLILVFLPACDLFSIPDGVSYEAQETPITSGLITGHWRISKVTCRSVTYYVSGSSRVLEIYSWDPANGMWEDSYGSSCIRYHSKTFTYPGGIQFTMKDSGVTWCNNVGCHADCGIDYSAEPAAQYDVYFSSSNMLLVHTKTSGVTVDLPSSVAAVCQDGDSVYLEMERCDSC